MIFMMMSRFLLYLTIFSFVNKVNSSGELKKTKNVSFPVFTWIDQVKIDVEFSDGTHDLIILRPAEKIANISVPCLYEGTMKREPASDLVISGCQNDPLVYLTMHSNRLTGTMFKIINGTTEEIRNPYANGEPQNESDDYADDMNERAKRSLFEDLEDYIQEDYVDHAADGNVDPPPRLNLNVKLGFEESLKKHLGSETAARNYVIEVFTHGRSYMKHISLGTSLNLNLVEAPIYVANKTWTAKRASLEEAKTCKTNEAVPIIYFCYDGDEDRFLGISKIRGACDPTQGVSIMKHREDIPLAANTYVHESGHSVGLQHDKTEDDKSMGDQEVCHGSGVMSEISPSQRPMQFTSCNSRRFKLWFNTYGSCLTEIKIPLDLKTCPYPEPSDIAPCVCKADADYRAYLFCNTMDQDLLQTLATSFSCLNKVYRIEIDMGGNDLNCNFTRDDIGSLEIEYLRIHNVSGFNADISSNAFFASSDTFKEIKIEKLPGVGPGDRTIRTEAFSNMAALKNIQLGDNFETLQTKSFTGLPSIIKLNIAGVKTIETKAFHNMTALKKLDLTQSPLETINTEAFFSLPSLTTIVFNAGTITTLETKAFSGLPSLSMIDMSDNKIFALPSHSFYNLTILSLVNLTRNQIANMSSNIFDMVPELSTIDISHNRIASLPKNAFDNMPNLEKIDLSHNKLASIDNNAVNNLPKLVSLDLSSNDLEEIGNFLENIKNRDLVVDLRKTKIKFLNQESFESFINNIVNQRGKGHIAVGPLELACRCDIHWMYKQKDMLGLTKFHNATCEEGHSLEEVDAKLLERFCSFGSCNLKESKLKYFNACVNNWCRQTGPTDQFTRCESATDGGLTCINPEVKYGTTEGGVPWKHSANKYDVWCQQILGFGTSKSRITTGWRDCAAPKGALFWCSSYDENVPKWCDGSDGRWKNTQLNYHSVCSKDGITSLTCSK